MLLSNMHLDWIDILLKEYSVEKQTALALAIPLPHNSSVTLGKSQPLWVLTYIP